MNNPFEAIDARLTSIECLLRDIQHSNKPNVNNSEVEQTLTIKEAASFLSLSVPTIYGLVQKAIIPVSKPGKRLYFLKSELIEWIKEGRRKTIDEIGQSANSSLTGKRA